MDFRTMNRPLLVLTPWLLATACVAPPVDETPNGDSTTAGDATATLPSGTPSTTDDPDTGTTSTGTTGGESADESTTTGEPVLGEGDECVLEGFAEIQCGPGLKCMPYSNDGGGSFNATACFPIDPEPVGLYEPCMWFGGIWSGLDNCGDRAFCRDWDGDGQGECIGMCIWTEDDWDSFHCEDRAAVGNWGCQECFCTCEPICNPLDPQACNEDELCIPDDHPPFGCVPDASEGGGGYGEECEFINVCAPGHFCINGDSVAACAGNGLLGCCAALCDLDQPNTCPGAAQGETCQPLHEPGDAPEGVEHVGYCGLPQ